MMRLSLIAPKVLRTSAGGGARWRPCRSAGIRPEEGPNDDHEKHQNQFRVHWSELGPDAETAKPIPPAAPTRISQAHRFSGRTPVRLSRMVRK